jgi:hypothetical protein
MEVEEFCHGHGLTRAGFIGRGAIAGGALLVRSAGLAGAANADDGEGHRHVPQPFEVPNTPLARAVADFAASAYPAFLRNHSQRSYDVATLIASHGGVSVDLEVLYAAILLIDRIMATRSGFAQPFIDAIVADLQDKPHVANGTWMMLIAIAHIASFQPISVETLAFNDPYEKGP